MPPAIQPEARFVKGAGFTLAQAFRQTIARKILLKIHPAFLEYPRQSWESYCGRVARAITDVTGIRGRFCECVESLYIPYEVIEGIMNPHVCFCGRCNAPALRVNYMPEKPLIVIVGSRRLYLWSTDVRSFHESGQQGLVQGYLISRYVRQADPVGAWKIMKTASGAFEART